MIQYSYHVSSLKTGDIDNFKDVVVQFDGYLYAIDENGKNTTLPFSWDFEVNYLNQTDFIDYDNLTPDIIRSWLESQISDYEQNYQKNTLANLISNFYNKSNIEPKGLPWNKNNK